MRIIASRWRPQSPRNIPAEKVASLMQGIPARIPGNVHEALHEEGCISDPLYSDNAKGLGWIENVEWCLEIDFEVSSATDTTAARLILDGVDTFSRVSLNGEEVGRTESMFLRYVFAVGTALRPGANRLTIEFVPVTKAVEASARIYPSAFDDPHRVHVRRMQCTFGWDWVHRFVTFGLSNPPVVTDKPVLLFPSVVVKRASGSEALLEARWSSECVTEGMALIRIHDPNGCCVAETRASVSAGHCELEVRNPMLWYPHGYGDQPIYRATFTLEMTGEVVSQPFGIRQVELIEDFDPEDGRFAEMTCELSKVTSYPLERGQAFGFRINEREDRKSVV